MDDVAIRIATWRKHKGLSQPALAAAAGVTASAVSYWETGKTQPSQRRLAAVVALFGLTMEQFYGALPEPVTATAKDDAA